MFFFLGALLEQHETEATILFVLALITAYNAVRRRSRLTRSALLQPKFASWKFLYKNADDGSFLHITGFDRDTFEELKDACFEDDDDDQRRRGRPPGLDNAGKLGLYLLWANSRMTLADLCLIFGVVESTASDNIDLMRATVIRSLRSRPESRIKWPSLDEMRRWAALVEGREPTIKTVIGFVDGLTVPILCSEDKSEQQTYYSGKEGFPCVNNVFAFSPELSLSLSLTHFGVYQCH